MLDKSKNIIKIKSFQENPPFECGYSLDVINKSILISIALNANGAEGQNSFPGMNGEMEVTGFYGIYCLDYIIETDLSITLVIEKEDKEILYMENQDLKYVIGILDALSFVNGNLPDFLEQNT